MSNPDIKHFALYGEVGELDNPDFVHIEKIERRSRLYDGNISPHVHNDLFQLIFINLGSALVTLEKQQQSVNAPCVITIPPGAIHGFLFEKGTQGEVLTLSGNLPLVGSNARSKPYFESFYNKPMLIDLRGHGDISKIFTDTLERITMEHAWPQSGRSLMLEWLIQVLLLHLHRRVIANQQDKPLANPSLGIINQFRLLVESHFRDHWEVSRYAAQLGLTENRLSRLCRTNLNKTPLEIIQQRLILEAERKLIYTIDSVSLIAYDLGFKDPAYFARLFKRKTGLTASAYRKERMLFKSDTRLG